MKYSKIVKVMLVSGLAAVALLGSAALLVVGVVVPAAIAHAESAVAAVGPQEWARAPVTPSTRLKNLFQAEMKVQAAQGKRLDNTSRVVSATQQIVDRQNAMGNDTAPLVKALSAYQATVEQARNEHLQAQGILDTHAGFDANGAVTDVTQARQTVREAGVQLRLFHLTMRQARIDLQVAIREFRLTHTHRPTA